MNPVATALTNYLDVLDGAGWRSRHLLNAGADNEALKALKARFPGPGSDSVVAWFGALNGMAPGQSLGEMWIIPLFVPMSVGDAVQAQSALAGSGLIPETWLPIMEDQAGWFYFVDVASETGAVIFGQLDMGLTPVVHRTLADMLNTYRAAVERRLVTFDSEGAMHADEDAIAGLAANLNPDVAWWQ